MYIYEDTQHTYAWKRLIEKRKETARGKGCARKSLHRTTVRGALFCTLRELLTFRLIRVAGD